MHIFLLGYNIGFCCETHAGVVEQFLRVASRLHRETGIPCTFFIQGRSLEEHADAFRRVRDECDELIDFQQSTYSGLPLKTVCQENHEGIKVFRGLSPEQCRESLSRTQHLMEHALGIRPVGVAGPLGCYRGLSDRPDILEVLHELGIQFVRSYSRNAQDWAPVAFEVQPFAYEEQGFPGVLEIPGQGWPDHILRDALGCGEPDRYVEHVRKDLDYVAGKGLTWSYVQHDWSSLLEDPEMRATRAILESVRERGFRMQTHRAYCRERQQQAEPTGPAPVEPETEALPALPRSTAPGNDLFAPAYRKQRGWRPRRMLLHARIVKQRGKPLLRRLLKKAGSISQRKLLIALSRGEARAGH